MEMVQNRPSYPTGVNDCSVTFLDDFILFYAHIWLLYKCKLVWMLPGNDFSVFCIFSQSDIQCLIEKMHFPLLVFHQVVQTHYFGEVEK